MALRVAIQMDPLETVDIDADTSFALAEAAQARGASLWVYEPDHLTYEGGHVRALARPVQVQRVPGAPGIFGPAEVIDLAEDVDVVLMRQDPPFNAEYIYATYLLEKVEREGVLVVNRPGSVRDSNEKLFATDFPQCCAPTLVSSQSTLLRNFVQEFGDTVMKPLDGMGGSNIFRVRKDSPNISVVIEVLTQHGKTPIMAQRFVPELSLIHISEPTRPY